MASIRKRKRAGASKWVVAFRDRDGKQHIRTCDTKDEAKLEQARIVTELGQATQRPAADLNITVAEYGERWLKMLGAKPGTLKSYEQQLRLHILPTLRSVRVRDLHQGHLRELLVSKLTGGLSRNTVRLIHCAVRSMLTSALDDGIVRSNCAVGLGRKLKLRPQHDGDVKALDRPQAECFLATVGAKQPRYLALFFTMVRTGVRIGEALGLHLADLDLERRELVVKRTLHCSSKGEDYWTDTPKNGKGRLVDVSKALQDVLRSHVARRLEENLKRGPAPSPWLFAADDGGPMHEARIRKAFERVLKSAGLPAHFTPHSTRHTFAIHLIQSGAPLTYVKDQLGHSSIQMTCDVYGRWIPTGNKDLIDALDRPVVTSGDQSAQSFSSDLPQAVGGTRPASVRPVIPGFSLAPEQQEAPAVTGRKDGEEPER